MNRQRIELKKKTFKKNKIDQSRKEPESSSHKNAQQITANITQQILFKHTPFQTYKDPSHNKKTLQYENP